ncbi:hypothetical protein F2Q69_00048221 [Brassica cretica]|uniref:Uncharacterized protein n=1 Tax=Brassica cretica TaxID=69181 RepID=A0A8S9PFY7_BRACR|nr:hypothetical protein F2Q69_00048221 [Brassica cretica]
MKQGHEDTMMGTHPIGRVTASSIRCSIFEYLMIASPRNSEVFRNHGSAFREHQPCHFWSSTIRGVTCGILEFVIHPNTIAYPDDLFLNSLRVVALSHQKWSGFDCTMIQRQKRRIVKVHGSNLTRARPRGRSPFTLRSDLTRARPRGRSPFTLRSNLTRARPRGRSPFTLRSDLLERQGEVAPAPRATSPQRHPEVARVYVNLRETNKPGATSHSDHLRSLPAP